MGRGGRKRTTAARQSRIRKRSESADDDESDGEGDRFPRPSSEAKSKSVKEYNKAIQNIRGISSSKSQRREMKSYTQVKMLK